MSNFEKVILIENQHSTAYGAMQSVVAELESAYSTRMERLSTEPSIEDTEAKLVETLKNDIDAGNKPMVVVVGGDGTVHGVVNATLNPEISTQKTAIFPAGGGNANDLKAMIVGHDHRAPSDILRSAQVSAVYGIQCELESQGSQISRVAAAYSGLGVVAEIAARLNQPEHRTQRGYNTRSGRLYHDLAMGVKALLGGEPSTIEVQKSNRQVANVFGNIYASGSRMAKIMRLPGNLLTKDVFAATLKANPSGKVSKVTIAKPSDKCLLAGPKKDLSQKAMRSAIRYWSLPTFTWTPSHTNSRPALTYQSAPLNSLSMLLVTK